jgi:hypothetical protein
VPTPTVAVTRAGGRVRAGPFLARFVELQVPMALGALACYLLVGRIPASSDLAAVYHPGTYLFAVGDLFFLSAPVAAWVAFRCGGWRRGLEVAGAMVAPVAAIAVLGEAGGYPYLGSLVVAGYPAMSLGMLADVAYRAGPGARRPAAS